MTHPTSNMLEGYIVHYILPEGDPKKGEHRAAIVVRGIEVGVVNLIVFMDGQNDLPSGDNNRNTQWQQSVRYSEGKEPGTWHWIETN